MFLCCPQQSRRSYNLNNYSNSNRHECFWTSGHLYFKCPLVQKLSCRLYMVVYKNPMEQEMAMEISPLHKIKCRCTGCEYAADDSGFCFFCEEGMCGCTCAGCFQVYKILIFIGPILSPHWKFVCILYRFTNNTFTNYSITQIVFLILYINMVSLYIS